MSSTIQVPRADSNPQRGPAAYSEETSLTWNTGQEAGSPGDLPYEPLELYRALNHTPLKVEIDEGLVIPVLVEEGNVPRLLEATQRLRDVLERERATPGRTSAYNFGGESSWTGGSDV